MAQKRPTTKAVADLMGVQMASVTGMVKYLAAEGFLKHVPYRGFKLTPKGRDLALRMLRRHRLIELFLVRTLGLGWDEVHTDAEQMEHAVSDALIERIDDYLEHPQFDPHGAPIPGVDGKVVARSGVSIAQLKTGDDGTVIEVEDKDPYFLRFVSSLGIRIGSTGRETQELLSFSSWSRRRTRSRVGSGALLRAPQLGARCNDESPANWLVSGYNARLFQPS